MVGRFAGSVIPSQNARITPFGLFAARAADAANDPLRPGLHLVHDGGDEAVLGAEVVDEETGAGADLSGQGAQGQPGQAVLQEVVQRLVDQLLASFAHETNVT
jgi:hypothetical protein